MNADHLLATGLLMQLRVDRVLEISRNVARKYRRGGIPHMFEAALGSSERLPVKAVVDENVHVPLRSAGHSSFHTKVTFVFPVRLLTASDRDIATWAREEIRFHQHKESGRELTRAREGVTAAEQKVRLAQRDLERALERVRAAKKRAGNAE